MKPKKLISDWPCSWEEHELVELRDGMRLSLREKLIWLEAMTEFAEKLSAGAKTRETPPDYRAGPGSA